MIEIAAIISCAILAGLTIFQLALIFGAPIGRYAWGGAHAVLPANLKVGSGVSILLYGLFAVIILTKAGVIAPFSNLAVASIGIWVLAVYFCIGVAINGISRSKPERNLMTPVALILAILTLFVAMN
ncbi:hypothetical protein D3C87_1323480 [compost metagenome]